VYYLPAPLDRLQRLAASRFCTSTLLCSVDRGRGCGCSLQHRASMPRLTVTAKLVSRLHTSVFACLVTSAAEKGFHRVYRSRALPIVYPTVEHVIRMVPNASCISALPFLDFPIASQISGSLFTRSTAIHGVCDDGSTVHSAKARGCK
jgi:hypothetical protein